MTDIPTMTQTIGQPENALRAILDCASQADASMTRPMPPLRIQLPFP